MSIDLQREDRQLHRYRSRIAKLSVLLEKSIALSDALSSFEVTGGKIPAYLDRAWEQMSLAIEAARSGKADECEQSDIQNEGEKRG